MNNDLTQFFDLPAGLILYTAFHALHFTGYQAFPYALPIQFLRFVYDETRSCLLKYTLFSSSGMERIKMSIR